MNGDSARFYYGNALKLYKELDEEKRLYYIIRQSGLIHWIFDHELDKALAMFEKSFNYDGNHYTLALMGEIYMQKNEFSKGLENYINSIISAVKKVELPI